MISEFIIKKSSRGNPLEDSFVRTRLGKTAGSVGILLNLLLAISKALIGYLSGSISIVADSINNLTDTFSSIVSVLGISLSAKASDEEHPYGHGRGEYLATLVVAAVILFVGFTLVKSSVESILDPKPVEFSLVSLLVVGLSILVKFWMFTFYKTVGNKINSSPLKAASLDSLNDVLVTSVVVLSFIFSNFTSLPIDGIAGIFVSLFILKNGYDIIRDMISELLGQNPDPKLIEDITEIFKTYPEIVDTHDLYIHSYGPNRQYASIDAVVKNDSNIVRLHEVFTEIEHEVMDKYGFILTIHMDLAETSCELGNSLALTLDEYLKDHKKLISYHDETILNINGRNHCVVHLVVDGKEIKSNEEQQKEIENLTAYLKEKYGDCDYDIIIDKEF